MAVGVSYQRLFASLVEGYFQTFCLIGDDRSNKQKSVLIVVQVTHLLTLNKLQ